MTRDEMLEKYDVERVSSIHWYIQVLKGPTGQEFRVHPETWESSTLLETELKRYGRSVEPKSPEFKQPKYPFGSRSLSQYNTLDPRLQRLVLAVADHWDTTLIEGHRSAARQAEMFRTGMSKIEKGGKHNAMPSLAIDMAPYPIDWKDTERFRQFGLFVVGMGLGLGIQIRWGGAWKGDFDNPKQTFNDLVHFEITS